MDSNPTAWYWYWHLRFVCQNPDSFSFPLFSLPPILPMPDWSCCLVLPSSLSPCIIAVSSFDMSGDLLLTSPLPTCPPSIHVAVASPSLCHPLFSISTGHCCLLVLRYHRCLVQCVWPPHPPLSLTHTIPAQDWYWIWAEIKTFI